MKVILKKMGSISSLLSSNTVNYSFSDDMSLALKAELKIGFPDIFPIVTGGYRALSAIERTAVLDIFNEYEKYLDVKHGRLG
ncbi:hypothetical protein HA050_19070 [Iodobacter sp. HSC-16F04]|uniref:Uncharacterized protein n=1 Tax=Iodobacter violaceini TaxID=3044271 RepID=A0ABX0KU37_9NEIS|nr:hypothetical protein [Iodobacter violacea]NHQ88210.1 hypothetical protein [Iodobacter violacea]